MTGYVGHIEKATLKNSFFRKVLFTGKYSQLVVMCLQPSEEIGREVHPNIDQFFRIEEGNAKFVFHDTEEHLVSDGDAVVVPAGTYHNVINPSPTKPHQHDNARSGASIKCDCSLDNEASLSDLHLLTGAVLDLTPRLYLTSALVLYKSSFMTVEPIPLESPPEILT